MMTLPAFPSDRDASGRDLGDAEIGLLAEVVRSGKLNQTGGKFTARFEHEFARRLGVGEAIACASGTAAIHAALACLRLQPGDEIVTSPVTDMGAILPICYEGAVPRFADVDASAGVVTPATVAAALGPRTRAVIVTHLFGLPAAAEEIAATCRTHGAALVEDCAQAFCSERRGKPVGTSGEFACWSLQQGKQMTTGEGGVVVARDPAAARHARLFVNKGWDYDAGAPDHRIVGLNLRWTELQAAVGVAQLAKLEGAIAQRRCMAARLDRALAGLAGVSCPPADGHSYWRYALQVDAAHVRGGATALGALLREVGIAAQPHYVRQPAFACQVFRQWQQEPVLRAAYTAAGSAPPAPDHELPGVARFLAGVLVLPWNERLQPGHVDAIAQAVHRGVERLR